MSDSTPAVIVLGNQKSGTSAIAGLVAERAGLSSVIDMPEMWHAEAPLYRNEARVVDFVRDNPESFCKGVVKDCRLTFLYQDLRKCFPTTHYVFVVRHPVDNIRSILDRVCIHPSELPFPCADVDHRLQNPAWRRILKGTLLSPGGAEEVSVVLSKRWVRAARVFLANEGEMHLSRYEDFMADKRGHIDDLCRTLGLKTRYSIDNKTDRQFQPRGLHRDVPVLELFPSDIIPRIETICRTEMRQIGYDFYSECGQK